MKTLWTPGPWKYEPELRYLTTDNGEPLTFSEGIITSNCEVGWTICEMVDLDETKANAALIALAPEMAEAILGMFERYQACDIDEIPSDIHAIARRLREIGGQDETN